MTGFFFLQVFRSQQHFRDALAGLHHWEHVFCGIGAEVHEHRTILELARFAKRWLHVLRLLNQHPDMPIGFGQLHKIGQCVHVAAAIPAGILHFLPLANHAQVTII